MAANMQQQLGEHLIRAAQVMEEQIDQEMNKLENLEEDDLEVIRRKRMEQMKKAQKDKIEMMSNGHGKYEEVADEKEFFDATKKSDRVVCLFYLPGNFRCKIVDKHFEILARKHVGTRFIHVNAEKVHFLTTRLNIRVIPTIAVIVKQQTIDYIRGFDELGGKDEFTTEVMENRLARSEVITIEKRTAAPAKKKIIRSGVDEYDNEEDW
uniref:Thioredoxin domain-containing protein 9 n=1 Tax=Caenorhabditis japonica TaxID=281687 RepID=A0A8R1ELZ8_CAEJA